MRRLLRWFLMLNKRLYKKAAFVVILALIPICITAFELVARQDSGFLHIVLAATDSTDPISSQVIDELLSEESIIMFTEASGPEQAVKAVKSGRADEAWIFPADMHTVADGSDSDNTVTVVAREQTVFLRLSHEKLTAALYKYRAKAYYLDFARTEVSGLDQLSDDELVRYFDDVSISEELFVFGNPTGDPNSQSTSQTGYLTSPIRGLLAILVVLCGMAAAMYCMQDEQNGTFSWVPQNKRSAVAFACILIAVLNVAAVVFISLLIAGLATNPLREILITLLYSVCCAVFCMVLKQIFAGPRLYGSVIPLFTVIMIALCPVFFDFRSLMALQILFPPTHYVNAVYDDRYLLYMVIYIPMGLAISAIIRKLRFGLSKK